MNGDSYFDSYNDLEVHRLMLNDKPRTDGYIDAILKNSAFIKGKTVMGKLDLMYSLTSPYKRFQHPLDMTAHYIS